MTVKNAVDRTHTINIANLSRLPLAMGDDFGNLLRGLPGSFSAPLPCPFVLADHFFPKSSNPWSIRFKFGELTVSGGQALVARLAPADEESHQALHSIEKRRAELDQLCREAFGEGERQVYTPHISLGYFPVRSLAVDVAALVDRWTMSLRDQIGSACIEFSSASLYAFISMVAFFKR
jgi:hypothetical protein